MTGTPGASSGGGRPRARRPPSDALAFDRCITYLCAAVALGMAVLAPLAYISKEAGIGIDETAWTLVGHGLHRAQKSRLGSTWPLSVAVNALAKEFLPPRPKMPEETPTYDVDGVPLERLSGRRVPDLVAEAEALLATYAADPSYTRLEDTAIFFRVLPRRMRVVASVGRPLPMRHLYQLTGGNRARLLWAKSQLREQAAAAAREREQVRLTEGSARRLIADSYGMAEIDPATNELFGEDVLANHTPSSPFPVPVQCVHPMSDVYGDTITLVAKQGFVTHNTYLEHQEDPYGFQSFPMDSARPCLALVLPMMCIGDKWEVICPPNMSFFPDQLPFLVLSIRMEVRDLGGPTSSLAAARAALARGVFDRVSSGEGSAPTLFTRAELLARAKRGPPRIQM